MEGGSKAGAREGVGLSPLAIPRAAARSKEGELSVDVGGGATLLLTRILGGLQAPRSALGMIVQCSLEYT